MNKETNKDNDFQVNLTNCNREPIHIPGLVQAHCVLVALDIEEVPQQVRQLVDAIRTS